MPGVLTKMALAQGTAVAVAVAKPAVPFMFKVAGAAAKGAVGAFVAACLAACTEPIVNRILVKRMTVGQALSELTYEQCERMFNTAIVANFIKFPFFEVVNLIVNSIDLPAAGRGTLVGMIFTTATLPITNYRFRSSMGWPVTVPLLFQAYLPTVMRDIVYGIVRNTARPMLLARDPTMTKTFGGNFRLMFQVVLASCVISAPGNELRGYCLQPPDRALGFIEFFQPVRFVRSTAVGALILSTSIATGAVMTAPMGALVTRLRAMANNQPSMLMIVLFLLHQVFESGRQTKLRASLAAAKEP